MGGCCICQTFDLNESSDQMPGDGVFCKQLLTQLAERNYRYHTQNTSTFVGLYYKCAANIVSLGKVNSGELAHLITYKFVAEREYCLYVAWSNIFIYMSCTQ